MQRYTVYYIWKLLYMFRVVPPPIIRSAYNCIYSIWYLSHGYCSLPLSWKSWICSSNSSTIAAGTGNSVTNTRCCSYSCMRSWWWVGVPPETCRAVSRYNKLCNVASCWICIGIFLRCTDPWTLNVRRKSSNLTIFSPVCLEVPRRINEKFNQNLKEIRHGYEAEFPAIRLRPLMSAYSLYGSGLQYTITTVKQLSQLCFIICLFPVTAIMEVVIQSSLLCRTNITCKSITNYFCHYIFAKLTIFNLGFGRV